MNTELIQKAKGCKTAEELMALAKEHSIELTEEQANEYIEMFRSIKEEIADDELGSVSGGKSPDFDMPVDPRLSFHICGNCGNNHWQLVDYNIQFGALKIRCANCHSRDIIDIPDGFSLE